MKQNPHSIKTFEGLYARHPQIDGPLQAVTARASKRMLLAEELRVGKVLKPRAEALRDRLGRPERRKG